MQAVQIISNEKPIGIFDSGVGGLTVMKEIIKELPKENILYLGDTARVPYGTRSSGTVTKYSFENAQFLISKKVKLLIVACNTSSSVSLNLLKEKFQIPVVGVVEPGARAAVSKTKAKRIAVIGTETTINSGSYERAIKSIDSSIRVFGVACPLFVPLVEEGWLEGEVVNLVAERYLLSLNDNNVDTLVLGCTHYPMIKDVIAEIIKVPLIDSAVETAKEVRYILEHKNMLCQESSKPLRNFFTTDSPEKFVRVGRRFLGDEIVDITKITLGG